MPSKSKKRAGKARSKSASRTRTKSAQRIVAPVGKKRRQEIKELSAYFPKLEKLKGKRGLTASELGQLTRAKKAIQNQHNLVRLTETQAKNLKRQGLSDKSLSGKGIRAIRLRNTSPDAKVKVSKDGVIVTSNGRTWEYHPTSADIDALAETGLDLLRRKDVWAVYLWTSRGRTSEGFADPKQWTEFLYQRYTQYHAQNDFVYGVAALLKEKKGKQKKRA